MLPPPRRRVCDGFGAVGMRPGAASPRAAATVTRRAIMTEGIGKLFRRPKVLVHLTTISRSLTNGGEGWALERKRLGGARQPVDSAWKLRRLRRPGERGAEGELTWAG
eukprot:scaffold10429_cov122-Isochrysis_galbana.AAC.8